MVYLTTDQRAMDQVPAEEKLPVKVKVPAVVDTPGPMMVGEMGTPKKAVHKKHRQRYEEETFLTTTNALTLNGLVNGQVRSEGEFGTTRKTSV
jgi:hypothetical protein